MNQALQHALVLWLQSLQKGQDFVIQQAPEVIRQWLHVALVLDVLGIIVCSTIFLLIFGGFLWRTFSLACKDLEESAIWIVLLLMSIGSGLATIVVLAFNIYDIIQIELAPKVWIMYKIMSVVAASHGIHAG